MILKNFYAQKKSLISSFINENRNSKEEITVSLFNDLAFKPKAKVKFPLVMFKYNHIDWSTSSENEYKADVDFSVFIVLNTAVEDDYLDIFDLTKLIDKALLLHPTETELRENQEAIQNGETITELITNSTFKVKECQRTVENDNWEKNEFFIWEINYKTTLIEQMYKKRYTMISNNAFTKANLNNEKRRAKVKASLRTLGYNLDDYYEVEEDGKKFLKFKKITEKLIVNNNEIKLK